MSVQLRPQQNFTVVRQIANHLDTDTYYVQAVIRNAYTDAILATLQLENKGSQRFKKDWQVPADTSGQGFYISIVTSVYTDSGYTTKSENYGDEETTYLVHQLPTNLGGGGGGGVDARTLRRIVEEVVKANKAPKVTIPKAPTYEMRWDEVLDGIEEVQKLIGGIKLEPTDLQPILDKLSEPKEDTGISVEDVETIMNQIADKTIESVDNSVDKGIKSLTFTSAFVLQPKINKDRPQKEEETPDDKPLIDIKRLTS